MNFRVMFLLLTLVTLDSTLGQDAKRGAKHTTLGSTPTVDQILDKYVDAIGGKVAVEKIMTRVMNGSVVVPAGSAPLQIYEMAPNKAYRMVDSPVAGISENGFNGAVAWTNNRRGLREMSGPEVESFKREYNVHRELRLKSFYPHMVVKGKEKIGDRDAYTIEATSADGTAEKLYFDAQGWLLIRWDVTVRGTTVQTVYEDFREVDGIKLPFTLRRSRPDFSWTERFDEIQHNLPIDEAKFDVPAKQ
ncbi:hypothetical protein L0337_25140 [candidate division KSB1 bacterium]|nr:hypothetical protein [candidate division KSB1 bacterium]